ncbi:hypothetical protein GA0116948_11555 [Chitinophaga costaii]|uniref:Uncharacterized protein n=1 Tax=Chitinophaga costaii TaxID=1335309 RepID=A0A1C4FLE8_9BACT|nr:hypothetical protein [Chitinophaga costaii]SCC56818.1 hypothetical protein GA0116948_11555 [Chitinophaga costaii]
MAIAVNFEEDFFELKPLFQNENKIATFESPQIDGSTKLLKIEIDNEAHPLLPDVYNLAFGPVDRKGNIDDSARLRHKDYSKVFSTIVLHAGMYLSRNREHFLGIDGSSNGRAYLYYRFIQRNFDYLTSRFNIYGLKYYVRITRFGKTQYQNPFNFRDILPDFVLIAKDEKILDELMYNYSFSV